MMLLVVVVVLRRVVAMVAMMVGAFFLPVLSMRVLRALVAAVMRPCALLRTVPVVYFVVVTGVVLVDGRTSAS